MKSSIVIIRNISSALIHYRSKLIVFGDFIVNTTHNIGGYIRHWLNKRKLVAILLTIVANIMLGYLFFLSWLTGFLASKYAAGKSVGEPGKVRSLVIPFRKWGLHLHHWLYSLCLIGLSSITGIYILTSTITYGLLGGLIFQGIYCYSDWHVILINRHKTRARERLAAR
jgi:hypothetical protein